MENTFPGVNDFPGSRFFKILNISDINISDLDL